MLIHITGASGSGTTTLGAAVAAELRCQHLDTDDYYWLPTEPPYTVKRTAAERLSLLDAALRSSPNVVLSGSVIEWGREIEDAFDVIVFLYVDTHLRLERLRQREVARFGCVDAEFLEWAAQYDASPGEGRSLAKHRRWLSERKAAVLELAGDMSVHARLKAVLQHAERVSAADRLGLPLD